MDLKAAPDDDAHRHVHHVAPGDEFAELTHEAPGFPVDFFDILFDVLQVYNLNACRSEEGPKAAPYFLGTSTSWPPM